MVYTEIRDIKGRKYYYRVISIRKKDNISKKRIYLGAELLDSELKKKEKQADSQLPFQKKKKVSQEIKKIKPRIIRILRKNKINRAGIFGSYARGEQKKKSDIDIAVNIDDKTMSLLGFIELKMKLEKALKKKIDLVEYSAIKPLIKDKILKEEVRII